MSRKIKTAVIYGDSISTTEYGNGGYEKMLKDRLNIDTIYNHAICASGITNTTPDNLVSLIKDDNNIHPNADLIIIWHGTNDWYWGSRIGTMGNTNENTFIGAINSVIQKLRKACPLADIVYLTPLFRYQNADQCELISEAYVNPNKEGFTLEDYYDVIIEMSKRLCFTTVDMRTFANFHYHNASEYLPDFVHPSKKGYEKITDILCNHINLLF